MKDGLVAFLEEQIRVEHEIVESLNRGLDGVENPVVRGALRGVSLDSVKHGEMYTAAVRLLTGISRPLAQEHLDRQRELVEKHIRLEAELIARINKVMPQVEDQNVKLLLSAVLSDEERHHVLLERIVEVIVQEQTFSEEDLWDLVWRNAAIST